MASAYDIREGEAYVELTMRRRIVPVLLISAAMAVTFACGWFAHAYNTQSANGLLDAGFTIVDPEGFEIAKFD